MVLIISVMAHEVAHGAAADAFGDPTAKNQGRLTLNALKHIDFFGSIVLPALLYFTNAGFLFGWAKPVPYNPYNLRNRRLGEFCVSIAGIATNFIIAIIFSVVIKFAVVFGLSQPVINLMLYIILLNVTLGVFNLVPIPPLDGSKIFFNLLPSSFNEIISFLEKYSLILVLVFVVFLSSYLVPILVFLYHLITGLAI